MAAVTEGRPPAWAQSGAGAHSADESAAGAPVEGGPNLESTATLFAGDTGALRLDTRRVIVLLLPGPALDARRQSKLGPVLMRDESVVRSRLHDLSLDLAIDREQELAFTRQIASAELELPVLLWRTPLTLLDAALLLFLRQRLTESDAQLECAVVSTQEMTEHLAMFQREATTDHARVGKQVQHAIDNAAKYSLPRKLRNSEDRFEVARDADFKQNLCADISGFSLHAAVRCGADDRQALEQLCRYITRPALANERVQTDAAGPGGAEAQDTLARRHHAPGHVVAGTQTQAAPDPLPRRAGPLIYNFGQAARVGGAARARAARRVRSELCAPPVRCD